MFNEQNEIRGDEWADVMETAPCYFCESKDHAGEDCPFEGTYGPPWEDERDECNRLAPEPEPLTDADLDAWHLDWCERNGEAPDLIPDGEGTDPSGEIVPRWRLA